jgi:hypothetical protein
MGEIVQISLSLALLSVAALFFIWAYKLWKDHE